jgi:methyl-accepting chemotaxis protein
MQLRVSAAILGIVVCVSTSACERFSRTRQCRALSSHVNSKLDEIEAGVSKPDKNAYNKVAAQYEALAVELGPLEFQSEQMARDVAEYASILRQTAKQLREASANYEDPEKLALVRQQLDQLTMREQNSVAKIVAWCSAR